MCCCGMNELIYWMSNVYSGFPQSGQMRTDASIPPPSDEDCCRSIGIDLVGWAVVNLSLLTSATFVDKNRSHVKPIALAGMTDVILVGAWGVPLAHSNPLSGFI